MGSIILWVVSIIIIFSIIVGFLKDRGRGALIRETKAAYIAAKQSGNKAAALEAGRKYYSAIRGGRPTKHDEQVIANDLAAM